MYKYNTTDHGVCQVDYQKTYQDLISKAKTRIFEDDEYFERHHIVPRCIGGSNDKNNLVDLTPEEHLIAHLLLIKIYPNDPKLIYAANMMKNRIKNNKEYGWVKRKFSEIERKKKKGIKRTTESIEKQRETLIKQYRDGRKGNNLGKSITQAHRHRISQANSGKSVPIESRSSLEGFVLRYGEIEGQKRYAETNLKKSNSLEKLIERWGNEKGTKLFEAKKSLMSQRMKGSANPFYGRSHSEETKELLRKKRTGKPIPRSKEHNQKIGEANRGKKQKIVTCPFCGKEGGASVMKQWHFEKCKKR